MRMLLDMEARCRRGDAVYSDRTMDRFGLVRSGLPDEYGDPMAPDPACYLTDEEIGVTGADRDEMKAAGDYYHQEYWLSAKGNGGDAR